MTTSDLLLDIPLFHGLPSDALAPLARVCMLRAYPKRAYLCYPDEPMAFLCYIVEGLLQVGCVHPEGKESSLLLLQAGDWFGELSLLDGEFQPTGITALEPSQVLLLPRAPFVDLLRANPDLALTLLTLSQRRLYDVIQHIQRTKFGTPFQRIARVLLHMAQRYGEPTPDGLRLRHRLTHQTLADFTGLTRETITETVSAFRNTQCLTQDDHRQWVILDKARLEREAQ